MSDSKNNGGHESRDLRAESKPPAGKIRVLVADDHPLVREALTAIINRQGGLMCCGEATSTIETQAAVALHKPDLILLDLWLGEGDGLELIQLLREQYATLRILVISQSEGTLHAERALQAGADGFVMKEQPAGEILAAIQAVLSGGLYVNPKVAGHARRKPVANGAQSGGSNGKHLTEREMQVLRMLGEGMGTRQIAEGLRLSFKTIETHRENIKRKLELGDATELVRYAAEWVRDRAISSPRQIPRAEAVASGRASLHIQPAQ